MIETSPCRLYSKNPKTWIPIKSPKVVARNTNIAFQNHNICISFSGCRSFPRDFWGSVCVYVFFYSFSPNKSDVTFASDHPRRWKSNPLHFPPSGLQSHCKDRCNGWSHRAGSLCWRAEGLRWDSKRNSPRKLSPKKQRHDGSMVWMVYLPEFCWSLWQISR